MSAQFELGSLRLAQARALTEVLGIAASKNDSQELDAIDAAGGIMELLDQAREAFLASAREPA